METRASAKTKYSHGNSNLEVFFLDELKDVYNAENQIMKALPKLRKACTSQKLAQAFEEHLQVTNRQISRLEQIFDNLGESASSKKCEAMEGLIDESETIIDETDDGTATRDVGLIMAAQKVEHYEIATYGGLAQLARTLGYEDVAEMLETTLEEEEEADRLLTDIAENDINYQASGEIKVD
jgi:ferritin-like metal-binding protein YciE